MRSMTGFGTGTASDGRISVTIEMRSVNQRFLELNIRMPHAYLALEDTIRNGIKGQLHRGKVDVFVTVQDLAPETPRIQIDYASLTACRDALAAAKNKLFDGVPVTLSDIISLNTDWFSQEPPVIDADACRPVFQQSLARSLQGMMTMREREGANIQADLLRRADTMSDIIESIAERRPLIIQQYEERLQKKMTAILEKLQAQPEQDRLLQEVAVYADKVDFTEEVVRFRSHVLQLRGLLEAHGDTGRKLDFLIQEMNRETNTIGSKAQDLQVTEQVLRLKNEIEKIREQVQNIE